MKKITRANVAFILLMFFCASTVFASGIGTNTADESGEFTEISNKIGAILNVIAWIGYAIAVGMLMIIAIKYMMSAANERADVKKGLINYVIGVIIIGAAATIANFVSVIAMSGSQSDTPRGMAEEIVNTGKDLGNIGN